MMKGRIDQKGQDRRSRKTNLLSSKSNRELKKLEWIVSYKKTRVDTSLGIFGAAFVLECK